MSTTPSTSVETATVVSCRRLPGRDRPLVGEDADGSTVGWRFQRLAPTPPRDEHGSGDDQHDGEQGDDHDEFHRQGAYK